jgi:hypothetical protein
MRSPIRLLLWVRDQAQPMIPFPAGMSLPGGYSITYRGVSKAFNNGFQRMPNLEVEQMRRLDTDRCEEIYRGLVPGIMRGDPNSGSPRSERLSTRLEKTDMRSSPTRRTAV